jgi:hypothetical protein
MEVFFSKASGELLLDYTPLFKQLESFLVSLCFFLSVHQIEK